jgi:hypothetical protein
MHRIFYNAKRRLDAAENDVERRRILKILGDASLEEHAEPCVLRAAKRRRGPPMRPARRATPGGVGRNPIQ